LHLRLLEASDRRRRGTEGEGEEREGVAHSVGSVVPSLVGEKTCCWL
jgi:hypothetical protein